MADLHIIHRCNFVVAGHSRPGIKHQTGRPCFFLAHAAVDIIAATADTSLRGLFGEESADRSARRWILFLRHIGQIAGCENRKTFWQTTATAHHTRCVQADQSPARCSVWRPNPALNHLLLLCKPVACQSFSKAALYQSAVKFDFGLFFQSPLILYLTDAKRAMRPQGSCRR